MKTIETLKAEYIDELNTLEQEAEERGEDLLCEDEDEINEKIDAMDFCLQLESELKAKGVTMEHTDFSAVSEAMYFDVAMNGEIKKLRIATHSSNYDKDINVEVSQFLRYSTYAVNEAVKTVIAAF